MTQLLGIVFLVFEQGLTSAPRALAAAVLALRIRSNSPNGCERTK